MAVQVTANDQHPPARRWWRSLWVSVPLSLLVGWLLAAFVLSWFVTTVRIGGMPARQMTLEYPNLVGTAVLSTVVLVWHLLLWRRRVRFGLRTLFLLTAVCGVLCATVGVRYMRAKAEQRTVARLGGDAVTEHGRVVELTLEHTDRQRLLDTDLEQLKYLPNLRKLSLRFARVTDDGLSRLRSFAELEELTLGHTGYLDADVDLTTIFGLTYQGSDVKTKGGIQRVQSDLSRGLLFIRNTKITDAGMEHVGQLKSLRVLCLDDTAIGDAGLEHLARLAHLEELNLERTYVTNDGLRWLTGLPRLERLWLSGTRFLGDAGMEHVCRITSLRELSPPWQTTTGGLELLEKLPRLEKLDLTDCQASLRPLARLPRLRELTAPRSTTDAELKYLYGLKDLRKLKLSGASVSDAAMQELQQALPQCQIAR
jgi:hypothetical protein